MKRSDIIRLLVNIFFLFSLITAILPSPAVAAGSFIPGWTYRKQITITGSTAGAQASYQMKLTVNRSTGTDTSSNLYVGTKCAADYRDLRFTANDGMTLLDYWIESSTASSATVWVEFVSIPASPGSATFYCYYGNAGASPVSNIRNTFVFGDDFEDGSLDTAGRWVSGGTGGSVVEAGGVLTVTASATDQRYVSSQAAYPNSYALHTKARLDSLAACSSLRLIGFTTKKGSYNDKAHTAAFRWYWEDANFFALSGNDATSGFTDMGIAVDTNYHVSECRRYVLGGVNYDQFVMDGGPVKNGIKPIATPRFIEINSDEPNKGIVVDWIFLRNFVIPEPSWGTWGTEETGGGSIIAPTVTNASGASNIAATAAKLNGQITNAGGENPTAHIYWGPSDGGTTPAAWAHDENLGLTGTGAFYKDISGLTASTTYFYRCYASNSAGSAWAAATSSFTTVSGSSGSLAGWNYRKQVSVGGSTTVAQTNYQKKVTVYKGAGSDSSGTVYLNNHCRDDFADIRFTRTDGATLLDYWVESYVSGVSAVIWVELDSVPAAPGTATFYCYYGNASAATSSNIQNTFVFGDDFDDGSLDTAVRWTSGGAGGTITEAGGALTITNSADDQKYVASNNTYGSGYALHTRARLDSMAGCTASRMVGFTTTKATYLEKYMTAAFRWYFEDADFFALSGDDTASSRFVMLVPGDINYHIAECRRYAAGGTNYDRFIMDGGAEINGTKPVATPRYIYIRTDEPSKGLTVDWVFLRKFVSPEPAWVIWGSEEAVGGGSVTLPAVTNSTGASGITATAARLNGEVTVTGGENPTVHVYWGTADGGTMPANWAHDESLGAKGAGIFFKEISGLTANTVYFYRYYAINSAGAAWAANSVSFTTPLVVTAPVVTNSTGASNITSSSARLNGEVTVTGGENPTVHVYWGTADGGTAAAAWAHDENLGIYGAGDFSKDLAGLASNVTYYYRCYAVNSGGSGWADSTASFFVPALVTVPVITNGSGASEITATSAVLNGVITSTGGVDPDVRIYWGTTDGGTNPGAWTKIKYLYTLPAGPFSGAVSGLTAGTTYYYRCWATNSTGTGWAPVSASFTTTSTATLPSITNSSGASAVTLTSAQLNGELVSTGGLETSVRIYYGTADGGTIKENWQKVKYMYVLPVGPFTSKATGLTAGTTYYYRCWASNSTGTIWAAGTASFTTGATGPTAPTVTNAPGATNVTASSVRLNGEITSTGGENPTVHIYWGTYDGGTTAANWTHDENLGSLSVGAFFKDISGMASSTMYYYRCYAVNSAGASWAGSNIFTTTSGAIVNPPTINCVSAGIEMTSAHLMGDLTSTGGENPTVHIYWGATDGGTTAANWSHDEYLGYLGAGAFAKDITGLTCGTTYYFRCYAVNSTGGAWAPASFNFTTLGCAPDVSNGLGATNISVSSARLSYNISRVGVENPTVHIFWGTTDGGTAVLNWAHDENLGIHGTGYYEYDISGLTASTTYYYTCYAVNSGGESWAAPSASFTTSPATVSPPDVTNASGAANVSSTSATLSGNLLSTGGGNPTVHVYWGTNNGGTNPSNWANDINLGIRGITGLFLIDITGLTPNTTYYYTCYAVNSAGASWAVPSVGFTTTPPTPVAPTVTNSTGASGVTQTSAQLDGELTSSGGLETSVRIYYGTTDGGTTAANWQKVKYMYVLPTGPFTSKATSLTAGTTYYYRCWASNSSGISWAANSASFTTLPSGPIAPTVTNSTGASNIGGNSARLNGKVTSSGGENPTVHIYWGAADGGTNPASWANDVNIGIKRAGSFTKDLSGLAGATTYYYRCFASNSAGSDWADSTTSFTTLAGASLPVVTNGIGATNVKRASIVMNGEIVSTGGVNPSMRIYYGTTDGGTNRANWQKVKYLYTLPAGPFSTTVSGLAPNTKYYYRCWATNTAGTAWAPASATFTTLP